MAKNSTNKPLDGPRVVTRGMPLANLSAIMDTMVQLYGDKGRDMTFEEVMKLHPDLVAKLDGKREIGGVKLSDEQISGVTHAIELGTTVRDAREKTFGLTKKKNDRAV